MSVTIQRESLPWVEVSRELEHLLQRIFSQCQNSGGLDLEAVEMAVRSSVHQVGAAVLNQWLEFAPPGPDHRQLPCACGHTARYVELRIKPVLTAVGKAKCLRPYYLCEHCHRGQFPIDIELDIETPNSRLACAACWRRSAMNCPSSRAGSRWSCWQGCRSPPKPWNVRPRPSEKTSKFVSKTSSGEPCSCPCRFHWGRAFPFSRWRWTARAFLWCTKKPKAAWVNSRANQRTHAEAKLGCVFSQTTVDEEGYSVRDEASTSYVGAIESCEEFGRRLYSEAWQRSWARAEKKVVLGDGAEWIWNQASLHFPDAIQIVDLYHAREHLWRLGAKLYPNDSPAQKRWVMVRKEKLDEGKIERLVASLRSQAASHPELAEDIRIEANYFEDNKERMRYPQFRKQGLFVGSGVIEAGCKTVLGRLKRSGMFWTVRGANAIITLRCCQLSGKFEDYWEARRA